MKLITFTLLFTTITYCQSAIVASGSSEITIGETFPIMQTITSVEASLDVPKFEQPVEVVKPIPKKKKSGWEKFIIFIKRLFK